MGLAVYPAPSTGGAAFPGAGSLVASAYTTKLYWTTTLSAGTYFFYGLPEGSPTITRDSAQGYDSNRNYANVSPSGSGQTNSAFSLHAYNQVYSQSIPPNSPAVFKLSTSAKVQFGVSWKIINHLQEGGMFRLDSSSQHGGQLITWVSGNQSDYMMLSLYNRDGNGWRNFIIQHPGPNGILNSNVDFPSFHLSTVNNEAINMCAHLNGKFWVGYGTGAAANKFYSSTDGTNWGNVSPSGLNNSPSNMAWSGSSLANPNANYVVISDSSGQNSNLASSTDGVTWATRSSGQNYSLYGVAYGANKWVVTGYNGACSTSADGITWTARTMPSTIISYSQLVWNATVGKFLAIMSWRTTAVGNAALSTDGITWTAVTIASKNFSNPTGMDATSANYQMANTAPQFSKLHVIDGEFVGYANGLVWTSSDGTNWTATNTGLTGSGAFMVSPTFGPALHCGKTACDDYSPQSVAYVQPAVYQVYSSTIV
jgi:hypothetical protein